MKKGDYKNDLGNKTARREKMMYGGKMKKMGGGKVKRYGMKHGGMAGEMPKAKPC